MKIIHQNGYSKDELLSFRGVIYKNVLDSAQALIMAMRKIGVDPEDVNNRVRSTSSIIFEYHLFCYRHMPTVSSNTAWMPTLTL